MAFSFACWWMRSSAWMGVGGIVVVAAAGAGLYFALRKKESEDEIEKRRRQYLLQAGRIIDGTVLDISDVGGEDNGRRHVFYKYEIAGVSYECSQDVTVLAQKLEGVTSTPGMPASIRYDPHNPTNSIVLAETWTGLHQASRAGVRAAVAGGS